MRSYLGFDAVPVQVSGAVQPYPLAPTGRASPAAAARAPRRRSTASMRVRGRPAGHLPLDQRRLRLGPALVAQQPVPGRKGHGNHGGVGLDVEEWLTLLAPDGEAPLFITLERRWERLTAARWWPWWLTPATRRSPPSSGTIPSGRSARGTACSGTTTKSASPAA
jgi:hypothetical protein